GDAWIERTLLAMSGGTIRERAFAARAVFTIELRPVAALGPRAVPTAERTRFALAGERALVAVAPALRTTLGELLVRAARLAGPALGSAAFASAAGVVVVVAVARLE